MNLQEILNYRKTCLIHENKLLKPRIIFFNSFIFFSDICVTEDSIIVKNQDPNMMDFEKIKKYKNLNELNEATTLVFKFDGTYAKPSGDLQQLAGPVVFHMVCDECNKTPIHSRQLSIDNFLSSQHYYTFTIFDQKNGKYKCELEREYVKYTENSKFYHVHVDLKETTSVCQIGSCNVKDTIGILMSKINKIETPNLNISNITDIRQLVDKCKLYNLFS
ncbi:MAG TPA: hypothetical protein VII94_04210 [Candidatus Saccharimonadales bacterium]